MKEHLTKITTHSILCIAIWALAIFFFWLTSIRKKKTGMTASETLPSLAGDCMVDGKSYAHLWKNISSFVSRSSESGPYDEGSFVQECSHCGTFRKITSADPEFEALANPPTPFDRLAEDQKSRHVHHFKTQSATTSSPFRNADFIFQRCQLCNATRKLTRADEEFCVWADLLKGRGF